MRTERKTLFCILDFLPSTVTLAHLAPIRSCNCWMILNVTLNLVPTYHTLYQACSNHSQLCKFRGLAHFKHPWAVSQPEPCQVCSQPQLGEETSTSSFQEPSKRNTDRTEVFECDFWELLLRLFFLSQHADMSCAQIPPPPTKNPPKNRKPCVICPYVTSEAVTDNNMVQTQLPSYTDDTSLDRRSLSFNISSSTLQLEQFL